MNPGFCEKQEVTRVPPERPSRTTSGTRTTGWEPLLYSIWFSTFCENCSLRLVTL